MKIYDEQSDSDKSIYIPIIIALLNFTAVSENGYRAGSIVDPYRYIENGTTKKDFDSMIELYQYNVQHQLNMKDYGWGNISSYIEALELHQYT